MADIRSYIPIRIRITGMPSDDQLDRLAAAVQDAVTQRIALADHTIEAAAGDRPHGAIEYTKVAQAARSPAAADLAEVSERREADSEGADGFAIPSYSGGRLGPVRVPATRLGAGVSPPSVAHLRSAQDWNVIRETFYDDGQNGLVVLDLNDGSTRTVTASYNGHPQPNSYLLIAGPTGKLTSTRPTGGTADPSGYFFSWHRPTGIRVIYSPPVLLTVVKGSPPADLRPGEEMAPREGTSEGAAVTGAVGEAADDLYFGISSGFSFGSGKQEREDRLVGKHIVDWARARAIPPRQSFSGILRRLQEKPGSEAEIVNDIHLHLIERIQQGMTYDLYTGAPEADDFEGSPRARDKAVLELERRWDDNGIGSFLRNQLTWRFNQEFAEALARKPQDTRLVIEPAQIIKTRNQPSTVEYWSTRVPGELIHVGTAIAYYVVEDFDEFNIYISLQNHPDWLYSMRLSDWERTDPGMQLLSRDVAENSQFAAMILPLIVKGLGASMTFGSGGFAVTLAGIAIDEVGEEGMRSAQGQPSRSIMEIIKDIGEQVFVDRVLHIAAHAVPETVARPSIRGVETFTQQQIEARVAAALRDELVDSEAPLVERELYAGHSQPVSDVTLRNKGYVRQVDVEVNGIKHTYYKAPDGTWCRHSGGEPICELILGSEVERAEKDLTHVSEAAPSPSPPEPAPTAVSSSSAEPKGPEIWHELAKELETTPSKIIPNWTISGTWRSAKRKAYQAIFGKKTLPDINQLGHIQMTLGHIVEKATGGTHSLENLMPQLNKVNVRLSGIYGRKPFALPLANGEMVIVKEIE
jgi:hypothetical protein